jgi:hypothetical protein
VFQSATCVAIPVLHGSGNIDKEQWYVLCGLQLLLGMEYCGGLAQDELLDQAPRHGGHSHAEDSFLHH